MRNIDQKKDHRLEHVEPLPFTFLVKENRSRPIQRTQVNCPYIIEDLSDIDVNEVDMFLVKKR